jgi:hypothetical protein
MKFEIPAGAVEGQHYTIIDGRLRPIVRGGSGGTEPEITLEDQPPPPPDPTQQRGTIVIEEEPPAPPAKEERTFTAEDIERARREEKDKLYPRLQQFEEELAVVKREREEREAAERKRQDEEAEALRRQQDEEADVRTLLEREREENTRRFAEMQQEIEQERAVFAMERQFQEIQQYRAQAIAAAQEDLMPELIDDLVPTTLTTKEAVDAAVARCKERSLSIVQQMQQRTQEIRREQRGVSPTGEPPVGPMENQSSQRVLTPDDIRNMSIEEYAKNRDKILEQVSEKARVSGPYGV